MAYLLGLPPSLPTGYFLSAFQNGECLSAVVNLKFPLVYLLDVAVVHYGSYVGRNLYHVLNLYDLCASDFFIL